MASYYADISPSYTGSSHAGTKDDPFSYADLLGKIGSGGSMADGDVYYLRGIRATSGSDWNPGTSYRSCEILAWDVEKYGPWRITDQIRIGDYGGADWCGFSLKDGILANAYGIQVPPGGYLENMYIGNVGFHAITSAGTVYGSPNPTIWSVKNCTIVCSTLIFSNRSSLSFPTGNIVNVENCILNSNYVQGGANSATVRLTVSKSIVKGTSGKVLVEDAMEAQIGTISKSAPGSRLEYDLLQNMAYPTDFSHPDLSVFNLIDGYGVGAR